MYGKARIVRGKMTLERKSGILMHPTSLPGPYGIGTLGKEASEFIDFLYDAGQKLWQICPLGPTGYGDSPYQSFSAFAGNPLLIDFSKLIDEGLLSSKDVDKTGKFDEDLVDFGRVIENKYEVLRKSYLNFFGNKNEISDPAFTAFCRRESFWLDDFSIFMTLKNLHKGESWSNWQKEYKYKIPGDIKSFREKSMDGIRFYKFLQYIFYKQWQELKKYANGRNITIIGDIPLFVAFDSSDAWSHPEYFHFNRQLQPVKVAGVPPDYFSKTGQLWGNPVYNWGMMKKDGFKWWIRRIKNNMEMYDMVRIDHFRGFAAYWAVPYGEATAVNGKWEKAPGNELFKILEKTFGKLPFIAEDLGVITPDVVEMREKYKLPGMKVLQFAFDSGPGNPYLPHNYNMDSVVYTGTHDNDTIKGWFDSVGPNVKSFIRNYIGGDIDDIAWILIRLAWSSCSAFAITPLQDILGLGSAGRMNIPGTASGNWRWRFRKRDISKDLSKRLALLSGLFSR